jgi:hypothetical protein
VRGSNRRDDLLSDVESLDQLLARTKLLTSVLIALCFPVFPVAIAVPYVLLEGGHLLGSGIAFRDRDIRRSLYPELLRFDRDTVASEKRAPLSNGIAGPALRSVF